MTQLQDRTGGRAMQMDAMVLLEAMADATAGSLFPAVLEDRDTLPMTAICAQTAFRYLKRQGLIEADFSIFSAARVTAAGYNAIAVAKATAAPSLPAGA